MRTRLGLAFCAILSSFGQTVRGEDLPAYLESPGAVAVSEGAPGEWIFRSFPTFMPLYTFEGDQPGKSMCDEVCVAVWPILRAFSSDKPIGQWTILTRESGRKQWAYKGYPVYMFYRDSPQGAEGIGLTENWYNEDPMGDRAPIEARIAASERSKKPKWILLQPSPR